MSTSWAKVTSTKDRPQHNPNQMRHDRYRQNYSGSSYNDKRPGNGYKGFGGRFNEENYNLQGPYSGEPAQFGDSLFQRPSNSNNQGNDQKHADDLWLDDKGASSPSNMSANNQGKWKSRRVEETKKQEREKQKRSWWYLDPQQEVQGPFSEDEMKDWFNEGFFGIDLPVRCHPDSLFSPLGDWFVQGNSAFLDKIPDEHRSKMDPSIGDANPEPAQSPRKHQSGISLNNFMGESKQQGSVARNFLPEPRHQFPAGSTLNGNAPIFNPMEAHRFQPPPSSNLNAKPQNPPPAQTDQNIFSHYRNQAERTKKGYTTQHDLRQNNNNSASTFDNAHNPLQSASKHTRPPMVSGTGRFDSKLGPVTTQPAKHFSGFNQPSSQDNSRVPNSHHLSMNRFPQTQQFFEPPLLQSNSGKDATIPPNTSNSAMIDLLGDSTAKKLEDDKSPLESGGWKEIGIPNTNHGGRQDANLSSPFGTPGIGADPYQINLHKHDAKSSSPWTRTIMSTEPKKSQSDIPETAPETDRRTNEHSQIQRNERTRSPPEQARNYGAWGLNGNNQRQSQGSRTHDSLGGKPRTGSGWSTSNSSWDTRPPRIPQVRNSQSPANQSRGSTSSQQSRNNQWREQGKADDGMDKTKRDTGGTTVLTQTLGSKNSTSRTNMTRKSNVSKGDPTLSANSKRSTAVSTKSKNKNFSESNPFGVKISPEFEEWCVKQIAEMTLVTGEDLDGRSLIHFLMTLSSKDEIREYIVNYLGDSSKVKDFADGFIRLKNFEGSSGGDSGFQCKTGKKRRNRRRKKGT